jgi:cbb3-type cytochrome oxidase subunit 3
MNVYQFALSILMVGVALLPLAVLAWIYRPETPESEPEYDYR